ncbi:MAG: vWA domain-containing protein, partial [Nanoarchaeota archaeon]
MSKKNKKNGSKESKKITTTTTTTTVVTTTTVEKNLDTHYLLVLDRSGSMDSCWKSTIDGLNEQLGTIRDLNKKYPEQRYFLTLVAFDSEIETIIDDRPIDEIKNFDGTEFPPRGMTALHDAMGVSITNLKANLAKKDKDSDSISTALVVIMTDGGENSSKEHNSNSVKKLIDELNKTGAWTFSYMGANQDAILTASNFGISAGNSIDYSSSSAGASTAYQTLNR